MREWYKHGCYNAICNICALQYKSDELQKNWKEEMVCKSCYETRHPQDFLRVRGDTEAPPWVRPEGEDVFISICYIWERSAYADLGTADCMLADNVTIPYITLLNIKG